MLHIYFITWTCFSIVISFDNTLLSFDSQYVVHMVDLLQGWHFWYIESGFIILSSLTLYWHMTQYGSSVMHISQFCAYFFKTVVIESCPNDIWAQRRYCRFCWCNISLHMIMSSLVQFDFLVKSLTRSNLTIVAIDYRWKVMGWLVYDYKGDQCCFLSVCECLETFKLLGIS